MAKEKLLFMIVLIFFLVLTHLSPTLAADLNNKNTAQLKIGTKVAPPFSMKSASGDWYGISVDLWKLMAQRLGVEYKFIEYDLQGLLSAVESKEVDLGIAALSITADREKVMDFSHTYYQTGLGLVVRDFHEHRFTHVFKKLTNSNVLMMVGFLFLAAVILAIVFWVLEKKTDNKYFCDGPGGGLGTAVLWAMKLVVSGSISVFDMKRFSSRALALFLSFFGMTFIAGYTAIITSTLTVNEINSTIRGPEDLPRFRNVVLKNSDASEYLQYYHINYIEANSIDDGFDMIRDNQADVMVHDKPLLTFKLRSEGPNGLRILPITFGIEEYGIALADESPLQEEIDQLLLELIEEDEYQAILHRYLSPPK